jgi:hypothetical protein
MFAGLSHWSTAMKLSCRLILALVAGFLTLSGQARAQETPTVAQAVEPVDSEEEAEASGPYDPKDEEPAPEAAPQAPQATKAPAKKAPEPPEGKLVGTTSKLSRTARPSDQHQLSVTGARPLPLGQNALRAELGYPGIRGAYHMPLSDKLEVAPNFHLFYAWNGATAGEVFGFGGGAEIKWLFYENGDHSIAATADPGLLIPVDPDSALGLNFGGPGVRYDFVLDGKHHLTAGVSVPWAIVFGEVTSLRLPVVLKAGAEFAIAPDFTLFFSMGGGVDNWTDHYPASNLPDLAEPYLNLVFGAGYRL